MALTACPDCGAAVSSEAAACPQCAKPIAKKSQFLDLGANARSCLGCVALLVVLVVGALVLGLLRGH